MEYLLKASGVVVILFLFYYFLLKNETYFKSIRNYFLIGLLIVVSIPLIEIPVYVSQIVTQLNSAGFQEISTNKFTTEKPMDWMQLLLVAYLLGVVVFSSKFLIQLASLGFLLSKHTLEKRGKFYFVETSKTILPFSFFHIIFYNKKQFTTNELAQIINHEKTHAMQWHSIDTILAHLLVIALWFNPFAWLFKKAIQQNLEFLADTSALALANNQDVYLHTLLKTHNKNCHTELANNFYNSLIKKRIIMLHKKKSKNRNQWKYTLLVPLLIAFVFVFNTKIIAQEKKLIDIEELNTLKTELVITSTSKNKNFKIFASFLKKQFDINLTFKGIKRNANNEIIAIKINAKGKNQTVSFENSGIKPIKPIKISYNSEESLIHISNFKETYSTHEIHNLMRTNFSETYGKNKNYVFVTTNNKKNKWKEKKDTLKSTKAEITKILFVANDAVDDAEIRIEYKVNKVVFIADDGKETEISDSVKKNNNTLFIIDGKEISSEEIKNIPANSIEKIEILKGEKAIDKYGKRAKDGVVIITTKKE